MAPELADSAAAALHRDAFYLDAAVPLVNARLLPRYLPDLQAGGVDAILTTVASLEDCHYAVSALADWHALANGGAYPFRLCATVAEFRAAKQDGVLAVGLHFQGGNPLEQDVDLVDAYHALGVRQMLFAYNKNNLAGGGCHNGNEGLTDFGRAVIGEMNRLGMVVDLSHCSHRTTMEAMALSTAPCIFSHSNSRELWDHERNIYDDQVKACAATGGVVGIVGIGIFLGNNDIRTSTLADHIDHYVNLVGPAHVGIGLDYAFEAEGGDEGLGSVLDAAPDYWPKSQYDYPSVDCAHPRQIFELTEELLRRQYKEDDVVAILGGNFMRVAEAVWK